MQTNPCETLVTSKGIEKLLFKLNPHKAAGPDQIKPIILTNLSTPLSPILKHLFQKSLVSETFPPIWKDANVAPVCKKCERSNPANYMPIYLTCILCKTLEHIVASSITKHLSKLNIFYELQHGFRETRSCESQLLMLVMIFSNPSIRKSKLISVCLTSARPLIKSATRNSLSNYMTMV